MSYSIPLLLSAPDTVMMKHATATNPTKSKTFILSASSLAEDSANTDLLNQLGSDTGDSLIDIASIPW